MQPMDESERPDQLIRPDIRLTDEDEPIAGCSTELPAVDDDFEPPEQPRDEQEPIAGCSKELPVKKLEGVEL